MIGQKMLGQTKAASDFPVQQFDVSSSYLETSKL